MVRFGAALPHYDFSFPDGRPSSVDTVVEWARVFESLGYDSLWISDHVFLDLARYGGPEHRFGSPEAMTTLATLARETERIRLGTLVLCYAFRNAVMLAKEAAAVDLASGGRLELGLGAGWYAAEFAALGIPFATTATRISELDEYLRVVRELLDGAPVSADVLEIEDAVVRPGPASRVPLWVGAKGGPRMLRLVAERADGWNVVWRVEPTAYQERLGVLTRACENAGRDPATVRRSVGLLTIVGENEADLATRWKAAQRWTPGGAIDGVGPDAWGRECLIGTADACVERIREFVALGVEEIIFSFAPLPFAVADPEMPQLVAERVLPHLR